MGRGLWGFLEMKLVYLAVCLRRLRSIEREKFTLIAQGRKNDVLGRSKTMGGVSFFRP